MLTVRRLRTGETDLYKEVRLQALHEAPYAFTTTYDSALQRDAGRWQEQAENGTRGSDHAIFIALSEEKPIGMAALYRREDQADSGELMQVWVHPDFRGTHAAWELMNVLMDWARENGFSRIFAGVTKGNDRALKFYLKYGFSRSRESDAGDGEDVYLVKEVKQEALD